MALLVPEGAWPDAWPFVVIRQHARFDLLAAPPEARSACAMLESQDFKTNKS